jgi:hypothetical protein
MIASFLDTLFHWPDGIVVGNLIASALWAVPAFLHLDRKMKRHHREHMAAIKRIPDEKLHV